MLTILLKQGFDINFIRDRQGFTYAGLTYKTGMAGMRENIAVNCSKRRVKTCCSEGIRSIQLTTNKQIEVGSQPLRGITFKALERHLTDRYHKDDMPSVTMPCAVGERHRRRRSPAWGRVRSDRSAGSVLRAWTEPECVRRSCGFFRPAGRPQAYPSPLSCIAISGVLRSSYRRVGKGRNA